MRPGAILVSIVSLLLSLSAVVWLSNSFGEVTVDTPLSPPPIADLPDTPRPSIDEGPQPTADFAETRHNFGVMQLHDKGSHVFRVTNNGDAPLKLKAGKSTCQCTVGAVGIEEVAPGESTTIEMSWDIRNPNEMFEHSAVIHTNAPEHENGEVRLIVHGRILADAAVMPPGSLDLGAVRETRSRDFFIYSHLHEHFELLSVECPQEGIATEFASLTDDELESLSRDIAGEMLPEGISEPLKEAPVPPKCGYRITVTAEPTIRVGINEIPLTLHTDLPKTKEYTYLIRASRPVPIQFFPLPGTKFIPDRLIASCTAFDAAQGTTMELLMLSTGLDKPLEVSVISTEPGWLEASVSEEKSNQSIRRFRLKIHVPPGTPPAVRTIDNPAKVLLKTNHPDVGELTVNVTFLSR